VYKYLKSANGYFLTMFGGVKLIQIKKPHRFDEVCARDWNPCLTGVSQAGNLHI